MVHIMVHKLGDDLEGSLEAVRLCVLVDTFQSQRIRTPSSHLRSVDILQKPDTAKIQTVAS